MVALAAAGMAARRAGGAVVGFVAAMPGWALGALVAVGVMLFLYEGLGPWKILWIEIGWPGWMDHAVEEQRRICEADKARSEKQAREDDQATQRDRITEMSEQVRMAQERALAAQEALRQDAELDAIDDAAEVAAGRPAVNCRVGPRGAARLQPRELPYPSTVSSGD